MAEEKSAKIGIINICNDYLLAIRQIGHNSFKRLCGLVHGF